MLLRYNAGHALFEDFVMQEAEQSELASHRMALRQVLGTLAVVLDHWTSSGVNEYQRELQRVAHSPELRRMAARAEAARRWVPRLRRAWL